VAAAARSAVAAATGALAVGLYLCQASWFGLNHDAYLFDHLEFSYLSSHASAACFVNAIVACNYRRFYSEPILRILCL
jgi:hypothetical protein